VLEVTDLSKTYASASGPIDVLRGVSFRLESGGRMVVMGPSGSGKSTLLSILGTLDEPTSGRVTLDGHDPFAAAGGRSGPAARAAFRQRQIGFVFQEHHLLGGCSALDNVVVPSLAGGGVSAAVEERARWLLDRVGLSKRHAHLPGALSGGERQRVAVARALVLSPRLILADEPTGQLDATSALLVTELLVELCAEVGGMLLVVTHADSIAARIGPIHTLVDGRLQS